jgi:hypothetical protein
MTQGQIDQRIAKFQDAEAKGQINWKEMEALLEALAQELKKEEGR